MYTQAEYLYGWLLYLLGVALMMGCGWYLTSGIRYTLAKTLLRVLAAVFFLVPWYASSDEDYLAPAWLIAAFEGIVGGESTFWRAGAPLLSALAVAVLAVIAITVATRTLSQSHGQEPAQIPPDAAG